MARGQVRLIGASIGGDLDCRGGKLTHPDPNESCLRAERVKVGGDVLLSERFHATGKVSLAGAAIDGRFSWEYVNEPNDVSELDLRFANIGTMHIDPYDANWPQKVILHGLEYGEINEKLAKSYDLLIGWLKLQDPDGRSKSTTDKGTRELHSPQPYEQLAEVLFKGGDADMARKVLVAMNEDRLEREPQPPFLTRWLWYRMFGPMIGYGHDPLKPIPFWLVVGWIFFKIGKHFNVITPSKLRAYDKNGKLRKEYPKFNSLVYTLDLFLPIIDLHQASYWLPNAKVGKVLFPRRWFRFHRGGLLRLYMWFHILLGWLLTMLLVAGLTGLVRT